MASAFSHFRKHQRWMIAVIGVLIMVGWGVGGIVMDLGGGGRGGDPVAAETSLYGDIHESELQRMRYNRGLANSFLQQAAVEAGFMQSGAFGPESEAAVVNTMLMARKAEQLGMRVTDEEISRFLRDDVTGGRVSNSQFADILKRMGDRRGSISRRQIYDAIRTELLALYAERTLAVPQRPTPVERWEAYGHLNSRASITAVAVPVEDFLAKVPDPTETELAAFFAKYKDLEPIPGSSEPGFKVPQKVVLQYVKADYEQFDDPQAVSYKEVVEEYEKYKDTRYLYSGDFGLSSDSAEKKEDAEKPADKDGAAAESTEKAASSSEQPAAGDKPAADAAPSGADKPADAAKEKTPQNESGSNGGGDGAEAADDKPADDKAKAADKPADANADKPADEKAKEEAPKDAPIKDDLTLPRDLQSPRYDPLWKVEKEIRATLARRKAVERMDRVLDKVREKMVRYGEAWSHWDIDHERNPTLKKPEPLDFDALAAAEHLTAATTPPLSRFDLRKTEGIGNAFVLSVSAPMYSYAFSAWPLYQPAAAGDFAGDRYIVWKTEQQEAYVPKLEDVRDEVVRAYKMIEARKPALERAKELVAKSEADKVPLAELARQQELTVITPEPFTWLTHGAAASFNSSAPPQQSEVQGVVDPGPAFMEAVFGQSAGGMTTAFNHPQSTVYAIEVNRLEPGNEVLHAGFLAHDLRTYGSSFIPQQEQKVAMWEAAVRSEAGLRWVREPDQRRESESDDGPAGD